MNHIKNIIRNNKSLIYQKKRLNMNDNFILSKDVNSSLKFIEITNTHYRFVFDGLNSETKFILENMNELSKKNNNIDIENMIWCGGGITITYRYSQNELS